MSAPFDRVRIWNSFFELAWTEAKRTHELASDTTCDSTFNPLGGTLPGDQHHVLGTLALCNLAIEARANHLLEELIEDGTISGDVGRAAKWLPTKEKWFLIPALAGKTAKLSSATMPHQAIAMICDLRNDPMHVKFEELTNKLRKPYTLLSYFENFVKAMEDMNVVLQRDRPTGPLKEVLDMGRF